MATRDEAIEKPQSTRFDGIDGRDRHPQEYYDEIKARFAEERDLRLAYRPPGTAHVHVGARRRLRQLPARPVRRATLEPRETINDDVEVLFIGGGFSALLTSARLRERGVESIRIVERGADVGGTWYWNRYPGVACDVVAYDYLPLLDEMEYVPTRHYAEGPEIFAHCQAIARRYDLYELAVFQTTVTSTVWDEDEPALGTSRTDRGDRMTATFVICANGTLAKPQLAIIDGMETFEGNSFHTSRWDYEFTGAGPRELLQDKVVGIIGTGRQRRADRPQPRREGQGAVRLPAHAVVDRHPRRLGDRSRVGGEAASRAGRPSGGPRSSPRQPRDAPSATRRCATGSPARRRSAARRTPTSTT